MSYAVENALYQWEEGERRVRETPEPRRTALDHAVGVVADELRRRLGSTFAIDELAAFYGSGTDWAVELASAHAPVGDGADVVDAAFGLYARGASNYAGRRP